MMMKDQVTPLHFNNEFQDFILALILIIKRPDFDSFLEHRKYRILICTLIYIHLLHHYFIELVLFNACFIIKIIFSHVISID